jgi:hypothetical protein
MYRRLAGIPLERGPRALRMTRALRESPLSLLFPLPSGEGRVRENEMAANVEIRRCVETDLAEAVALFEAWEKEASVWGLRAEPVERLRERMGEFFFVARAQGRAVGFAIGKRDTERFCIFPDGKPYLEVEDDGPGIPEAERVRVRERYYRMPGSPGRGCGLGLAIVDEISRLHHADLTIDAGANGRGTLMKVRFPAATFSKHMPTNGLHRLFDARKPRTASHSEGA